MQLMSNASKQTDFFNNVQIITERFLTKRARIRHEKKEKRRAKNPVLDWLDAFLWAACMVLLANQYLVQAYRIPSGSMIDSLKIGDHVFVNKIIYGPELLPGFFKLPSLIQPKRNDIIIFENPAYFSRGTAFDITQRVIYMLTLTLIDIDKDDKGDPKVHFLIKRSVGYPGDRVVMDNGNMKIRFSGEDHWIDENEYNASVGWKHNISRLMTQEQYPALNAAAKAAGWMDIGLYPSETLYSMSSKINEIRFPDLIAHEKTRIETQRKAAPHDTRIACLLAKHRLGWYIPEGRVLPMGDNRDNSKDGRYFGPVKISKILGKGMIIYWPLWRMRIIK
jgi:signal peptidase I